MHQRSPLDRLILRRSRLTWNLHHGDITTTSRPAVCLVGFTHARQCRCCSMPPTHAPQSNSPDTRKINKNRNRKSTDHSALPLRAACSRFASTSFGGQVVTVPGMDRISISVQRLPTQGSGGCIYPTADMSTAARSVFFIAYFVLYIPV